MEREMLMENPAMAAERSPIGVIPPLVPGGTDLQGMMMRRGMVEEVIPISLDQVSPVLAA